MTVITDETVQKRTLTLTVHLTTDERYEGACLADQVAYVLASELDDTLVDAVVAGEYVSWGRHLTETAACPHCTATLEHPLSDGLGCTNDWHHKGDRRRRQERRSEILGGESTDEEGDVK